MIDLQKGMFGEDVPAWKTRPPFGTVIAERLWWLWDGGRNQVIADDDAEMVVEYWATYEGLEQALGPEALEKFRRWFTDHNPTPSEELTRTRRWETSDETPGGPYMIQSPHVKRARAAKAAKISSMMRDQHDGGVE